MNGGYIILNRDFCDTVLKNVNSSGTINYDGVYEYLNYIIKIGKIPIFASAVNIPNPGPGTVVNNSDCSIYQTGDTTCLVVSGIYNFTVITNKAQPNVFEIRKES